MTPDERWAIANTLYTLLSHRDDSYQWRADVMDMIKDVEERTIQAERQSIASYFHELASQTRFALSMMYQSREEDKRSTREFCQTMEDTARAVLKGEHEMYREEFCPKCGSGSSSPGHHYMCLSSQ